MYMMSCLVVSVSDMVIGFEISRWFLWVSEVFHDSL